MNPGTVAVIGAPEPDIAAETDFVHTYQDHYRGVVVSLRLAGASLESAEEVAQEAFVRAYGGWPRISRGLSPAGYIYRAAFRIWARRRRHDARQASTAVEHARPGVDEEATTRVTVLAVLAALPPRQRACAVLHLQAGLDHQEIARILHMRPATVRVHVHHARQALRDALMRLP